MYLQKTIKLFMFSVYKFGIFCPKSELIPPLVRSLSKTRGELNHLFRPEAENFQDFDFGRICFLLQNR